MTYGGSIKIWTDSLPLHTINKGKEKFMHRFNGM